MYVHKSTVHTYVQTYAIAYYMLKDFVHMYEEWQLEFPAEFFKHPVLFIIIICPYFFFTLDCSLSVQADMLCRMGHVCATCFMDYNGAFRLLWLHCFKPYEHQFVGKVNAVYDMSKLGLCRVRKLPADVAEQCSVKNCANGRKCTKAHSVIELKYWNTQQGIYIIIMHCYRLQSTIYLNLCTYE